MATLSVEREEPFSGSPTRHVCLPLTRQLYPPLVRREANLRLGGRFFQYVKARIDIARRLSRAV